MLTKTKLSDWIHRDLDILILPIAFVVITVILGILNPDKFLTGNNISAMAFQIPELGLFTFAMMIAMITGGSTSPLSARLILREYVWLF